MKRNAKYNDPEKDDPDARHESERIKHYPYDPGFVVSKYSSESLEYPCDTFTSLRLSNINPRVPDEEVREGVYQSFKKFGEFNIKFAHTVDRRLVYVNFAYNEDAIVARNALSNRLELFDRLICIETVNHNRQWNKPANYRNDYINYRPNSPGRLPAELWDAQRRDIRLPEYYYQPRSGEDSRHLIDLKHIPPEEDRRATRTLFVANIDDKMDPEVLKKYFDQFGLVEDVDIKCPMKGNGNPYAFVKFLNLDMAYASKVELSGQMLGRYQCKIGYARPVPTTCVWVGGLTDAAHKRDILAQFEKFGKIVAFKWPRGQKYAYVAYDSVDSAQLAIVEMRGFPLPGTSKGLRTDFAELKHMEVLQPHEKHSKKKHKRKASKSHSSSSVDERRPRMKHKRKVPRGSESAYSSSSEDEKDLKSIHKKRRVSSTSESDSDQSDSSVDSVEKRKAAFQIGNVEAAETIVDLARCLPVLWSGPMELKNSTFYTQMHLVSGNGNLVDTLLAGLLSPEYPALKISQRLRLDKSKLKEVEKQINLSGSDGHCVLLAVSENSKDAKKHRPLTSLVSYLKQKNAAGVLSLPSKTKQNQEAGLLHTFPPCEFAYNYLQTCAPKLTASFDNNEYIVVILVKVNL